MENKEVIMYLKLLKNILSIFIDSFLVLYFLTVSENNILPLGIYKLIGVTTLFITLFLFRNISKSKNRKNLLIAGIMFDLIYFLFIFTLKESIIKYSYILGIIYGLEEGLYYSVFNSYESDGITNKERLKFYGNYETYKSLVKIIFPIIFGVLITKTGFIESITLVMIIVILRIVLSFLYKDNNVPEGKTNLKKFLDLIKDKKDIKYIFKIDFYNGFIFSSGAFTYIVTIYIIKVFNTNFSLGIFTSLFSLASALIGYLFANYINKKEYPSLLKLSTLFTTISLLILLIKCNLITIICFNFLQTILSTLFSLINDYTKSHLSNIKEIRTKYKIEYYLCADFMLFLGRSISYILFILMAFISEFFIIPIFIIILILLIVNEVRLQSLLNNNQNTILKNK